MSILGAASFASLVQSFIVSDVVSMVVLILIAGTVGEGQRWQPAHVTRLPWWASALAGAGALFVAGGSLVLAHKLGLASATIASFRRLTGAVLCGLIYSVLGLGDYFFARSAERMENEGDEVRERLTLARPKKSINSRL